MKLTTITIPAVEMTRDEYHDHWDRPWELRIEGKRVLHWNQNDGHNEILLEGEDTYRAVVIKNL